MLDLLLFYPLMFYFGWKARAWLASPFGNALFLVELLCLAAVASVRIYYFHVIVLRPVSLAREVQRFNSFNRYTHLFLAR